ncbi:hypothetical protein HYPSUDRAFT_55202 [Hypholoma sublateritium FD-334 SS-4]|uniref:Uncharacterized protein n=1 Tax=Hypholoma sublateritium (strain FD-334 SS-4) TaxID=945553 RepID=A0A0D2ME77_HYPSF|nr:hypothetical protein HYPSUDRAFT_55202 [Hypholoma sublateritium FD-334 SS-4]
MTCFRPIISCELLSGSSGGDLRNVNEEQKASKPTAGVATGPAASTRTSFTEDAGNFKFGITSIVARCFEYGEDSHSVDPTSSSTEVDLGVPIQYGCKANGKQSRTFQGAVTAMERECCSVTKTEKAEQLSSSTRGLEVSESEAMGWMCYIVVITLTAVLV